MREKEKHLLILTILFLMVNGILFWKLGVSVDDDTERYLTYAKEIRERGIFFKPHDFWYIAYPLFIILMTSIHDSLAMVVLGQVALSYVALMSLYVSGRHLFGDPKAGLVTGLLFLGFFMISFWNFWIYCESLLISLNCLSFYFLIKWFKGEGNSVNYLVGVFVIIMAFFTKPTGIALLGGILLSVAVSLWKKENFKQIKWVVLTGLVIAFFILLNSMLSTFGFVEAYQMGEIVYNIHKLKHIDYAKYLIINAPDNLFIPDSELPALWQFVFLIIGNPIYSLKLFGTKLLYYIFYVRPYYSILHNVLALLVLVPVYFAFMNELFNKELRLALKFFIIGFVGISTLSSTLLTVDWNSRFLVAVLPVIFVLSSRNILYFLNPVSKRIKVKSF